MNGNEGEASGDAGGPDWESRLGLPEVVGPLLLGFDSSNPEPTVVFGVPPSKQMVHLPGPELGSPH